MMRAAWLLVGFLFLIDPLAAQVRLRVGGGEVLIFRDSYGVPHIFAQSLFGVFYGSGYAQACDRLEQMELSRRTAKGELASLMGEGALEQDKQRRLIGYTEQERMAQFRRLDAELQLVLTAFAAGVTHYIDEVNRGQKPLPQRLKDLGMKRLDPWKVTDTIAIGQMMAVRFGSSGGEELRMLQLFQFLKLKFGHDAEKVFNDIAWQNDPEAPVTARSSRTRASSRSFVVPSPRDTLMLSHAAIEKAILNAEESESVKWCERLNLFTRWGSYAMVVAPRKSQTGRPLLVGGPQMATGTPSIVCEIRLSCPRFDVRGMTFPGIPIVLIGMSRYLAWTTTSGAGDNVDIFVETLHPDKDSVYLFKGQWIPLERRVEKISVKGREEPVEIEVFRTLHGPVLSFDKKQRKAFSRGAAYRNGELGAFRAIYGFHKARTLSEFARFCRLIKTSHNFFCATKDGDIGFWYCGAYPIRADGHDPRLPTPGTGEFEWNGLIPFERLPSAVNPPEGFLANWNNKPSPDWDNGDLPRWGAIHHMKRIENLLTARKKVSVADLIHFVVDIEGYDIRADYFKPLLVGALKRQGRQAGSETDLILDLLVRWDHQRAQGSVAATIFDKWFEALQDIVLADDLSPLTEPGLLRLIAQPSFLWHVLSDQPAIKPSRDYLNGETRDKTLIRALEEALQRIKKERGDNPSQWGFQKPLWRFDPLPPIPGPNRGAYIQIVEVTSPPKGLNVLPPGQSEDPRSPHYADQHPLAFNWRFKPMVLEKMPGQ
ncbi:MAG: penicillin acylase family protein [Armatimonadetes bacterium]|nr:penicillin acylase family protein [Armatimonadota bacterium]MDW8121072.1 penicillin acylase family protein [Armatimonadota bacterium]